MHKIFQLIGCLLEQIAAPDRYSAAPFDNLKTFSSIAAGELGRYRFRKEELVYEK